MTIIETRAMNDGTPFLDSRFLDYDRGIRVLGIGVRNQTAQRTTDLLADLWGFFPQVHTARKAGLRSRTLHPS